MFGRFWTNGGQGYVIANLNGPHLQLKVFGFIWSSFFPILNIHNHRKVKKWGPWFGASIGEWVWPTQKNDALFLLFLFKPHWREDAYSGISVSYIDTFESFKWARYPTVGDARIHQWMGCGLSDVWNSQTSPFVLGSSKCHFYFDHLV